MVFLIISRHRHDWGREIEVCWVRILGIIKFFERDATTVFVDGIVLVREGYKILISNKYLS